MRKITDYSACAFLSMVEILNREMVVKLYKENYIIDSKSKLRFYILADRMMNRGYFKLPIKMKIMNLFFSDEIMNYLICLRKENYYSQRSTLSVNRIINKIKLHRLGVRLGFTISPHVFGYGLVIPHYGTIVVGEGNNIGNYCVLHTAVCITEGNKKIGEGFYVSTGAKILKDICLADGISVAANSVVNQSERDPFAVLAGMPAKRVKESEMWYVRDGSEYSKRVQQCEKLKIQMGL